jgi:hypothetical protein
MVRIILLIFAFAAVLLGATAQAAVSANVDRTQIQEGETFHLIIKAEDNDPDLSVLGKNFEILNTAKSSQMQFINGRVNNSLEWIVTLLPKRTGKIRIPAIKVGNQKTKPLTVNVVKANKKQIGHGQNLFLEAFVEPETAYVQQQIVFTIRFYNAVEVREGSLSAPELSNVIVERLGKDVNYQTSRNGKPYRVTERKYSLFPQQSGPLVIPPIIFNGQIVEQQPSSNDPFNRFFSSVQARPVRLKTDAISLHIKAKPATEPGDWWLPAQSLKLSSTLEPAADNLHVGDPITRTIRMEAEGLTGAQLPTIGRPDIKGLQVYEDQPTVKTFNNNDTLIGMREEKLALMPSFAGTFTLPAFTIRWYNVKTNKFETAQVDEQVITVKPAKVQSLAGTSTTDNNVSNDTNAKIVEKQHSSMWIVIAVIAIVLWLATMGYVMKLRKQIIALQLQPGSKSDQLMSKSTRSARRLIKSACEENNSQKARQALLHWARLVWSDDNLSRLSNIKTRINNEHVSELLDSLDDNRYGKHTRMWDGVAFWKQIENYLKICEKNQSENKQQLSRLYPAA